MSKIRIWFGMMLFVFVFSFFGIKSEAATVEHSGYVESPVSNYTNHEVDSFTGISLYPNADPDTVYEVKLYLFYNVVFSKSVSFRNFVISVGDIPIFTAENAGNTTGSSTQHYLGRTTTVYLKGSKLINQTISAQYRFLLSSSGNITYNSMLEYRVDSITAISGDAEAAYEEGYNAGYSEGSSAGYNAGYETGYSSGSSAGYNAGYQTGYSAGINSVDTQSYYDKGYQTGQAAGFTSGYESGFESGYQQAMSVIESWGADSTSYPKLIHEYILSNPRISINTYITNYGLYENITSNEFINTEIYSGYYSGTITLINKINADINPNHIYKVQLNNFYSDLKGSGSIIVNLGSNNFITGECDEEYKRNVYFFVKGDSFGNSLNFTIQGVSDSSTNGNTMYIYFDSYYVYDYGPIGNTQNQIANQTDDLTNGFDNSVGQSVNQSISNDLTSYTQAEGALFESSKSVLDSFEFTDFTAISSITAAFGFINSVIMMIYNSFGGAGGIGILVSVSFCVLFASLLVGIHRFYKSKDGG